MKSKSLIIYLLLSFLCQFISAQNLIQNPSFETFISCPGNASEIWKAPPWKGVSVDYLNACCLPFGKSVPYNDIAFQPAKTGVAYTGFIAYTDSNIVYFREIPQQILQNTLIKDKRYCGSYFVNLADGSRYGIDCMEIYISKDSVGPAFTDQVGVGLPIVLPGFPSQIKNTKGVLTDTSNWVQIEGSFIAEGGEKYFYMGCLSKWNNEVNKEYFTYPFYFYPPGLEPKFSYYFIDDVSLYELNKLPTAQNHAYNCAAQTVTLRADTGFNFRWYYLPDTVNVLSTADTFVVDASTAKHVLHRATLCSTEFSDTVFVPKLDCTGLENNALAQGASLFPNPASSLATFSLQGVPPPGTQLHLTDLNGRELRSYAVTGKTTVMDVNGLANGVYFVRYQYKENVIWKGKLCKFGE
jgi:hypothetical protein